MDAAERIRVLMKERGWSMYMLSKKSGLSSTTLQTMFARHTMPSIPTVEAICGALGITMAQFFSPDADNALDADRQQLLAEYDKLPDHQRRAVLELLRQMNIQK